ncbi:hypothetical protein [Spiroplasma tabanidicola]|uniref:HTH rpiR-type domain-containing protein n=1 Tax=Spiroplasma tabanidicola TaxID=324079 RepID=A0A6I6C6Q4_9MOLU|nr:hypothetical protein [Spiroplasma tabanidicola]QGS51466.1 hypothetical protein STABA_v1c00990 [Spiroplasma tabanidicola]
MESIVGKLWSVANRGDSNTYKLIAKKLNDCFIDSIFPSQRELSSMCFCSISTITQFSKSIGLEGYRELIVRLKVELERFNFNSKKDNNNINNNFDTVTFIKRWLDLNKDFINKLTNKIKLYKKITLLCSYHLIDINSYLKKITKKMNVEINIIDLTSELFKYRTYEKDNTVNLAIISGFDNESLCSIYLPYFLTSFENAFLLISHSQHEKIINLTNSNVMFWSFYGDDSSYEKRFLALILIFNLIFEEYSN